MQSNFSWVIMKIHQEMTPMADKTSKITPTYGSAVKAQCKGNPDIRNLLLETKQNTVELATNVYLNSITIVSG